MRDILSVCVNIVGGNGNSSGGGSSGVQKEVRYGVGDRRENIERKQMEF